MSRPVVFRLDAAADVQETRDYYERQRPGLGDEFADAIDDTLALIAAQPELFAVVLRGGACPADS